jgi:hypothetical protein
MESVKCCASEQCRNGKRYFRGAKGDHAPEALSFVLKIGVESKGDHKNRTLLANDTAIRQPLAATSRPCVDVAAGHRPHAISVTTRTVNM